MNPLKLRCPGATVTVRVSFGWSWLPLLKVQVTLALVFISSLLAQLFGLVLILQQIIDKVLSQGNLSSLNARNCRLLWLFRIRPPLEHSYLLILLIAWLTLGSAVIDRLLALPLSYFDKRPVGELSQRLGELNTVKLSQARL